MIELIPKIEEAIEESGLKRIHIAKKIGVTRDTLRSWCKGISYPNALELFMLCIILDKEPTELYETIKKDPAK